MYSASANALQTVNPGESIVFTASYASDKRGLVRHRDDTGNFLLRGYVPNKGGCCCCRKRSAEYLVDFGANIAVPTGGTAGEISVAIVIDGATIPASTMIATPAAVEEVFNVSRAINADVWRGCCQTVTVRNTSDQPILVQNANILFSRPDLYLSN